MRLVPFALAAAGAVALLAASIPARADWEGHEHHGRRHGEHHGEHHGWRHGEHRGEWREHARREWRDHEWREHHR